MERFWKKVDRNGPLPTNRPELGPCWMWMGCVGLKGYGRFIHPFPGELPGVWFAHRVAYRLVRGLIPKGKELDHLCRNHRCVNPGHLEAKTHKANLRAKGSMVGIPSGAKKKAKTHCPYGHPYVEGNLYYTAEGYRNCRTCVMQRETARRKLKKGGH